MVVKKTNIITSVAALALVFGAGPAFAQYGGANRTAQEPQGRQPSSTANTSSTQTNSANAATKANADETFAKKATEGGIAEVKLGELAEQRGSNQAVKNFGRRMVQDHSRADNELKNVSTKENVALPSEMNKSDQATYDRLAKLSGDAFDRAYARDMVKDHSKDVSEFQKEAKNGRDASIKSFAAQTLPTLQNHLDQAKQMEQAVNRASSSASNAGNTGNAGSTYPSNTRTNPGTTSNASAAR